MEGDERKYDRKQRGTKAANPRREDNRAKHQQCDRFGWQQTRQKFRCNNRNGNGQDRKGVVIALMRSWPRLTAIKYRSFLARRDKADETDGGRKNRVAETREFTASLRIIRRPRQGSRKRH